MGVLSNEHGKLGSKILDAQFSFSRELDAQNQEKMFVLGSNPSSMRGNDAALEMFAAGTGDSQREPVQPAGTAKPVAGGSCNGGVVVLSHAGPETPVEPPEKAAPETEALERALPRKPTRISRERVKEALYFTNPTASEKIMAHLQLPAEARKACKDAADSQGMLSYKDLLSILQAQKTPRERLDGKEPEVSARNVRLLLDSLQYKSPTGTPVSCKIQPLMKESYNLQEFVELLDRVVRQVHRERSKTEALSLQSVPPATGLTEGSSAIGSVSDLVRADHVERMSDTRLPSFCLNQEPLRGLRAKTVDGPAVPASDLKDGDRGSESAVSVETPERKEADQVSRVPKDSDQFPGLPISGEEESFRGWLGDRRGSEDRGSHPQGSLRGLSGQEAVSRRSVLPGVPETFASLAAMDLSGKDAESTPGHQGPPPSSPSVQTVETAGDRPFSSHKSPSTTEGSDSRVQPAPEPGQGFSHQFDGAGGDAAGKFGRSIKDSPSPGITDKRTRDIDLFEVERTVPESQRPREGTGAQSGGSRLSDLLVGSEREGEELRVTERMVSMAEAIGESSRRVQGRPGPIGPLSEAVPAGSERSRSEMRGTRMPLSEAREIRSESERPRYKLTMEKVPVPEATDAGANEQVLEGEPNRLPVLEKAVPGEEPSNGDQSEGFQWKSIWRRFTARSPRPLEPAASAFNSDSADTQETTGREGSSPETNGRFPSEDTSARFSAHETKPSPSVSPTQSSEPWEGPGISRDGFVQQLRGGTPEAAAPASSDETGHLSLRDASWPRGLAHEFKELTTRKGNHLTLELEPKDLGRLTLTVETDRNHVTAWVSTETEQARLLLSQHTSELRQCMQEQGLLLGEFFVGVKDQKGHGTLYRQGRSAKKVAELGGKTAKGYGKEIASKTHVYGVRSGDQLLSVVT